jgi:hypothetical protein
MIDRARQITRWIRSSARKDGLFEPDEISPLTPSGHAFTITYNGTTYLVQVTEIDEGKHAD